VPIRESLPQVSRLTKVPLHIIQDFQQNGILHTPLVCGDRAFLHIYALVREALGGHFQPPRKRRGRLSHWSLKEEYQKWIYLHYINDLSGEKIYAKDVIWKVSGKFVIPDGVDLLDQIERIRQIAYDDRRRARREGKSPTRVGQKRLAQLELDFAGE